MFLKLYPENPNPRYIKMILECLEDDGVIIFPTDTIYGIGCSINSNKALERIARIKGIKKEKANFSFIFHDLSMLSDFTRPINNDVFKMMKRNLPGPFTFIVEANNNVPKIFKNNKKTIGIRIPDQPIITNIVRELGCPILTTSIVDEDEISGFMTDPEGGRSPGRGNCNPLQRSYLGNPRVRGAWRATVHCSAGVQHH